jgi:hypothetical protein
MNGKILAQYLSALMEKDGLTDKIVAERCNASPETVKNLRTGKTDNPGIFTASPIIYAANGSVDAMLGRLTKNDSGETFANAVKELSEYQLKINETHINNIRAHYERQTEATEKHHTEIVKLKDEHTKLLRKVLVIVSFIAGVTTLVLVCLLILEVMNPDLGWLRF